MLSARLYLLQRFSAILLGPFVIGHLITVVYAIQNGLDANEILSRTQGSLFWALFYSVFVLAVAVHAAIGVRVILFEWIKIQGVLLSAITWLTGLGLFVTGIRAVIAVVL